MWRLHSHNRASSCSATLFFAPFLGIPSVRLVRVLSYHKRNFRHCYGLAHFKGTARCTYSLYLYPRRTLIAHSLISAISIITLVLGKRPKRFCFVKVNSQSLTVQIYETISFQARAVPHKPKKNPFFLFQFGIMHKRA